VTGRRAEAEAEAEAEQQQQQQQQRSHARASPHPATAEVFHGQTVWAEDEGEATGAEACRNANLTQRRTALTPITASQAPPSLCGITLDRRTLYNRIVSRCRPGSAHSLGSCCCCCCCCVCMRPLAEPLLLLQTFPAPCSCSPQGKLSSSHTAASASTAPHSSIAPLLHCSRWSLEAKANKRTNERTNERTLLIGNVSLIAGPARPFLLSPETTRESHPAHASVPQFS